MKSERAEAMAIADEVKRQAMAHAEVAFSLDLDGRRALRLPAEAPGEAGRLARLAAILGADFADNALAIDQLRDEVRLVGHAGVPTFNRGNGAHQYLFVNGRPVRDRLLQGALRAAYADFLARDRHPVAALYLELDSTLVDVNVHPAKAGCAFATRHAGARPDRRRAAPRAPRSRPPRLNHRRRRRFAGFRSGYRPDRPRLVSPPGNPADGPRRPRTGSTAAC